MQNSELYRRGIVIPLDVEAELSLRNNDVTECTNVRVLQIPDDGIFEKLWRIGLFQEINSRCSTLLDDYEEGWIEAKLAQGIVVAIETVVQTQAPLPPAASTFLVDAHRVITEAVAQSRPVLFVL